MKRRKKTREEKVERQKEDKRRKKAREEKKEDKRSQDYREIIMRQVFNGNHRPSKVESTGTNGHITGNDRAGSFEPPAIDGEFARCWLFGPKKRSATVKFSVQVAHVRTRQTSRILLWLKLWDLTCA